MRACLGIIDGYFCDTLDGGFGVDGTIVVQQTAMTVIGVFAETDVASNVDGWEQCTDLFDSKNDGTRGIICGSTSAILFKQSFRV